MSEQMLDDSMLEVFLFESSQLLEQLETIILACEEANAYPLEQINDIFRIMHTIKGSSSMMSFQNIATLSHALEDLFSFLRKDKLQLDSYERLSDLMLEGIDFIKIEIEKIRNKEEAVGDAFTLIAEAKSFLAELMQGTSNVAYDKAVVKRTISASPAFTAIVYLHDCAGMENVRAFQVIQQLQNEFDQLSYIPEDLIENFALADTIEKDGIHLSIPTNKSYEEVKRVLEQTSYVRHVELSMKDEVRKAAPQTAVPREKSTSLKEKYAPASHQPSFISVNVAKLDELMDLVGELVIAEAMVTQNPEVVSLELEQFVKAARHLKKITDEIQDKVMSIRMVPLTNTFQKMHRIVRDMSKKLDKNIQLKLIGEDTEVDKNIIEHISDPLMHIVRNSIDHGIETREQRIEKGKSETGALTLEAKNTGNEVLIFVKDDGCGLNKEKLLQKARENQLLHKNESEMTDREIYNLIFLPGFSTKKNITEFSGRGVGMDVVTRNIGAVGGAVTVDSELHIGTTITIRIPLTLAIIDGMNVRVGEARYTLPTLAIIESFRPAKSDIITDPDGQEMIMVRGACYPILRLHERYNIQTDVTRIEEGILIIAEQDGQHVCIFADELLGQQQIVVKALPAYIKKISKVEGITGCTLLGDGSISLILDIAGLMGRSKL